MISSMAMDEQLFIPSTMTACIAVHSGDDVDSSSKAACLSCVTIDAPKISSSQYLIRVHAFHISPYEHSYYQSIVSQKFVGTIPGMNFCGSIVATPTRDHWNAHGPKFKVADEVVGIVKTGDKGAAADYVLADGDSIALKPPGKASIQAAALPTPILLAWEILLKLRELRDSETYTEKLLRVNFPISGHYDLGGYIKLMLGSNFLGPNQFDSNWEGNRRDATRPTTGNQASNRAVILLGLPGRSGSTENGEQHGVNEVGIDLALSMNQVWNRVFSQDSSTNWDEPDFPKPDFQSIFDIFSPAIANASFVFDTIDFCKFSGRWNENQTSNRGWLVGITDIV